MQCPNCKEEINDNSIFCYKCGKKIPRCPTCDRVIDTPMETCPDDGTPLPEEVLRLIPGWNLDEDEEEEAESAGPRWIPILVAVVIILVLGAGSVAAYNIMRGGSGGEAAVVQTEEETTAAETAEEETTEETTEEETTEEETTEEETTEEETTEEETEPSAEEEVAMITETSRAETSAEETTKVETTKAETTKAETTKAESTKAETTAAETKASSAASSKSQKKQVEDFAVNSASKRYSESDFENFDAETCRLALNGVYAYMGRKFDDKSLQSYYEQFDWYHPTIDPDDFSWGLFNSCQTANLDLLAEYMESKGYR